jgi:16S rRNA (cytosine967-C5)-methyltransferase
MTPAARVAAAVELLTLIQAGGAADRQTAAFFRNRRFAGSKDRGAITEQVYGVLRRQGELAWRLGEAGAAASPRNLLIAALADDRQPEELAALFDGSRFGLAPLDDAECALAAQLAAGKSEMEPDWVRGAYPEWLDAELRDRFSDAIVPQMQALLARAPVDLRVNQLKGNRAEAIAALAAIGIAAEPTPYSPLGLRLEARADLARHAVFQSGLIEPQDEGSQLVALLVGARPRMQVLDLCAGAGGKSLALAAEMANRGQIYACDSDPRRLGRLSPRLERAGARNVQVHRLAEEGDKLLAELAGKLDRVLLDVPCSGIGAWRRHPEARWQLTPAVLQRDQALQAVLLEQAAPLVRPGGRIVYATCSLLPSENERPVQAFLGRHPSFALVPTSTVWAETEGVRAPEGSDTYLRLTPQRHGTDGFFAAILERSGLTRA